MKQNKSLATLFPSLVMVALALCFACNNSRPQKSAGQGSAPPTSSDPSACKGNCEDVAEIKIIHTDGPGTLQLTPSSKASLIGAMKATPAASSGKAHIHADVVNGELNFSPEVNSDPSHVTGAEPKISVVGKSSASSLPVSVVATPAAAKLLQARTQRP